MYSEIISMSDHISSQLNWFEDMIYFFGLVKSNSMIIKFNDENVKVALSVKM